MVLRKCFYIRWSAGRSPWVHEVNPSWDPSCSVSWGPSTKGGSHLPGLLGRERLRKTADSRWTGILFQLLAERRPQRPRYLLYLCSPWEHVPVSKLKNFPSVVLLGRHILPFGGLGIQILC